MTERLCGDGGGNGGARGCGVKVCGGAVSGDQVTPQTQCHVPVAWTGYLDDEVQCRALQACLLAPCCLQSRLILPHPPPFHLPLDRAAPLTTNRHQDYALQALVGAKWVIAEEKKKERSRRRGLKKQHSYLKRNDHHREPQDLQLRPASSSGIRSYLCSPK